MTRKLSQLLGLAVLCVVLNHAANYGFNALFFWTNCYLPVTVPNFDQYGSPPYWGLTLIKRFIVIAVPIFLFVSGYFIAFATRKDAKTVSWDIIKSRTLFLFVPYFIWSTLIFLFNAVAYHQIDTPQVYLLKLLTGGATGAYYYIPLIIQCYALSRWLVPWARKHWASLLGITAVLLIGLEGMRYFLLLNIAPEWLRTVSRWFPIWFFPKRIFWFSLGMVLGFHGSQLRPFLTRWRWLFAAGTLTFYIASIIEFEWLIQQSGRDWIEAFLMISSIFYALFFILTFISFPNVKLPRKELWATLGSKAFAVYLLNALALEFTGRILYEFVPAALGNQLVYQPIMIAGGLGLPLLLMWMVQKSPLRPYARYLFG
jgi:hypothetical protein